MLLIIDSNKRRAESISDMFYYMGILSYAATPGEALNEISSVYKAILVSEPDHIADVSDFIHKLNIYSAGAPVFSISDDPERLTCKNIFLKNYNMNTYSSVLAQDISNKLLSDNLNSIGIYRLAGIDASCGLKHVKTFDTPLPYTKTETMILRYLISTYPMPQSPKKILKYAFKQNRKPDITGIRTHISVMNKKFRQARDRNVITSIPDKGYVISTPEILKTLNKTG